MLIALTVLVGAAANCFSCLYGGWHFRPWTENRRHKLSVADETAKTIRKFVWSDEDFKKLYGYGDSAKESGIKEVTEQIDTALDTMYGNIFNTSLTSASFTRAMNAERAKILQQLDKLQNVLVPEQPLSDDSKRNIKLDISEEKEFHEQKDDKHGTKINLREYKQIVGLQALRAQLSLDVATTDQIQAAANNFIAATKNTKDILDKFYAENKHGKALLAKLETVSNMPDTTAINKKEREEITKLLKAAVNSKCDSVKERIKKIAPLPSKQFSFKDDASNAAVSLAFGYALLHLYFTDFGRMLPFLTQTVVGFGVQTMASCLTRVFIANFAITAIFGKEYGIGRNLYSFAGRNVPNLGVLLSYIKDLTIYKTKINYNYLTGGDKAEDYKAPAAPVFSSDQYWGKLSAFVTKEEAIAIVANTAAAVATTLLLPSIMPLHAFLSVGGMAMSIVATAPAVVMWASPWAKEKMHDLSFFARNLARDSLWLVVYPVLGLVGATVLFSGSTIAGAGLLLFVAANIACKFFIDKDIVDLIMPEYQGHER